MNPVLKNAILILAAGGMLGMQSAPSTQPSSRPATGASSRPTTSRPTTSRQRRTVSEESTKYSATFLKTIAPVAAKAHASVAVITINGHDIYATVVRADGYLVTKASELKTPTFDVKLSSGATLKGKIVACATDHDIALIQVPTSNLTPVEWADPSTIKLGEIVIAPGEKNEPIGWGVLSVLKRPLANGMMGVLFIAAGDTTEVQAVSPGMPAEKAGIKAGDVITHINSQEFDTRSALQEYLATQTAGTDLTVTVRRGSEDLTFHLTLISRPPTNASSQSNLQNTGGNAATLSDRRTDFPSVLETDVVLYPTQQGGPLINLEGKAIGINIARGGRVETYATPAEVIQKLLPDLMDHKFPATTHPAEMAAARPIPVPGGMPNADGVAPPDMDKETKDAMLESLKKNIQRKEDELARGQNQLKAMKLQLDKMLGEGPSTQPSTKPSAGPATQP